VCCVPAAAPPVPVFTDRSPVWQRSVLGPRALVALLLLSAEGDAGEAGAADEADVDGVEAGADEVSFPDEQPASSTAGTARRGRSRFMIVQVPRG
jgi:hypothetical protein